MKVRFLGAVLVLGGLFVTVDRSYAWCGPSNRSPTAVLTVQPEYVKVGRTVIFDGSGSYDPDGYIARYDWDFGDNNGSSDGNAIELYAYSSAGTYTVELTVTDNDGADHTADCNIYVGSVFNVTDGLSYDSIQAAIDEAGPNDVIKVEPGRYIENVNFTSAKITLTSTDPNDPEIVAATIIDGGDANSVVTFGSGDGDSVVTGFTIINGLATDGGGIYCDDVSPEISKCVITVNRAAYGGGMYFKGSAAPTVTNCLFSGNWANDSGGGMINWQCSGTVKVIDCIFRGNGASNNGGGIVNYASSVEVINCAFSGNSTTSSDGGGMFNYNCSPTVTNCTFSKNSAGDEGGGMYNGSSADPDITNCIFWDNNPDEIDSHYSCNPNVTYCDVKGGYSGTGNINADPCFADANGLAGQDWVYGTRDDGLFLRTVSPCIDKGSNAAVEESTDITGNNRIANGDHKDNNAAVVDMGAYEVPVIWYVDENVEGGSDNGKSWGNAYDDLQEALGNTDINDGNEIWVADGNYMPTAGSDRTVSFELIEGVAVYGGFAGGESSLNGRDWSSNETILSGDIDAGGSDDSYNVVTGADGAVLDGFTITGSKGTAGDGSGIYCPNSSPIISNCTITGNMWKGGIYSGDSASPTIINCTIINNSGSGIHNDCGSSPKIVNCVIADNEGFFYGGGMNNLESVVVVINCVFSGNSGWNGGGIHNYDSSVTVTNCTFSRNDADSTGGGMWNDDSRPMVTNCIFWDNNSVGDGEEIYNNDSEPFFGYCDINDSGGSGDWDTSMGVDLGGNIDADPCFVDASDPNGPDYIFRTSDDGLRLGPDSTCIDVADGDAAPSKDILGVKREPNYVDVGAYEFAGGGIVVMCWIDESKDGTGYQESGGEDRFEADLAGYRDVTGGLVVRSGCLVPNPIDGITVVLPIDYPYDANDPPEGITVEECSRYPWAIVDANEFIDDFNRIRRGVVPDYLILTVDSSGSMGTGDINPGYDDFVDWIKDPNNGYGATELVERKPTYCWPGTCERWVLEIATAIDNL